MNKFKFLTKFNFSSITCVTAIGFIVTTQVWLFKGNSLFSDDNRESKTQTKTIKNPENAAWIKDQFYTTRNVVDCLDTIYTKRNSKSLHIAFIGDSLVRNQYTSFIKLIPDYDRRIKIKTPWWGRGHFHDDHSVTHELLNGFKVSFLWRPVINDALLLDFKKWNVLNDLQVPSLIFLGATVHHMLGSVDEDRTFEQMLESDLLPLLRDYLAADPLRQLVWLYQPISLDKHVSLPQEVEGFPQIHFQSIRHYNEIIRRLLYGTWIKLWDFDSFVEEYTRSCALVGYLRNDPVEYFLCKNNFHPGDPQQWSRRLTMNKPKYLLTTSSITAFGLGIFVAIVYVSNRKNDILKADPKNHFFSGSLKSETGVVALELDRFYTTRDVVDCFDTVLTKRHNKTLHIAFLGDSLIRNQYTNYIKLIPDYDRSFSWDTPPTLVDDRDVTYRLLNNLKVSFLWRPLINEKFLAEFKKWKVLDEPEAPCLIFVGATVHHMLNKDPNGRSFEQLLEDVLLPVLRDYLATHPHRKLVWLTQPPTLDNRNSVPIGVIPDIHSERVRRYNDITRQIFNGTRIAVWDLFDPFVEEYIRSCALLGYQRFDNEKFIYCPDFLHPGFGVSFSFATHLLFNYICDFNN